MFNSMEDQVYHMFMYHDTVHGLWTALTQMYAHARNESRIFELYREISHSSQTSLGLSIADYFGYLQTRWEELAQYEPLSDFLSDRAVESKRLDRQHTYQFLIGLKSEFETLRTHILNTSPLPSLYEAFAIVDGDEQRRRLLPSLSLLESCPIVPNQRAFASSSGTHLYCQHCHKPGHLIDRCWVLHPELKQQFSQPRGGGRGGGRSGGRGRGTPRTGAIAKVEPVPAYLPDFKQLQLQIAQLQSHLGLATASQSSSPTAAIVAETPTTLHGKSGHPTWILDSGANNHMTGELTTFTSPITSVYQSVCIDDGSSIPIRSQGVPRLSFDITLSPVYYVPHFAYNLLSVSRLAKDLNCAVVFLPSRCFLQNLTSKKIFGKGYERDGLYYFGNPLPSSAVSSSLHVFSPPVLESSVLSPFGLSRVLQGKAPLHVLQPASTLFFIISRVFGCTCFVQNRSPTRTKLDDKAVHCIFFGYSSMSKGYRCYDPATRHMYHSLDVTFLETVPFFSDCPPSPGSASEILAVDDPIPPRPLPILEPPSSTPPPNGSLPPIASQDPNPRAPAPLSVSSPESGMSPPLVSDIPPPREVVLSMGFQQCHSNHTCFIRRQSQGRCIIISVYVDDIIITGDDASGIVQVKCGLRKAFNIKDLGPLRYFLGIEVARSRHGISLSQRKYSLDLLQDTGMLGCRPTSTPMVSNLKILTELGQLLPDPSIYQQLVGRLIYLTNTRPDLTFAVNIVSQFMHSPRTSHLDAVYHILRYLNSCSGHGLFYKSEVQLGLSCFIDADYAGSKSDRRSTSGFCTFHGSHLISWKRVITPSFVPSFAQTADMFTKSIGPSLLKSSLVKLGLVDIFASA
ncbi:hypothetical protein Acr_08g0008400 [Actinidia rufa]|uniref:Reverse transcriptase Ty1/copia-type domain-containing protein n=1 Tax=Actinidia rufa TaxID=165716 RepID=A0A7J0F187_9ERIC|nr:hypothetical protein Acr_08g0008400 [Actinidia rufa]